MTHPDTSPVTNPGPLAGLVVADFTRVLAGPLCTMMLGDLGATVIKVESPAGDDARSWRPPEYQGMSTFFQSINRNKYSIALNLKDPGDFATAQAIAARADIFAHNFKPGSIERLGLGYDDVRALKPNIIYAHISGFGSQPGGHDLPGYDLLAQGFAGLMDMIGNPDEPPMRSGVSVFDLACGMLTCTGILAALRHRDLTGEGQLVENNLMSTAIFTMINQYQKVATGGAPATRRGQEHQTIYPYNAMPTGDGDLIIVAANNHQFTTLTQVLGVPDLAADPRFNTPENRNLNRDSLRPLLEVALARRGKAEWFALLRQAGLPCAPVQNVAEGLATAYDLGLHPVWDSPTGRIPSVANAMSLSASPPTYRKEPPYLNEDAEVVAAWLAGSPLPGEGGAAG